MLLRDARRVAPVGEEAVSGIVSIGLVNPKTPANVGSVMRAAGCFGAGSIYVSGPRFPRRQKYATDPAKLFRGDLVPVDDLYDVVIGEPPESLVAVELGYGGVLLPEFAHPRDAFYLFGPEDGSIPPRIVDRCRHVVRIPMAHPAPGACLNLAAAVNIVLYDRCVRMPSGGSRRGDV